MTDRRSASADKPIAVAEVLAAALAETAIARDRRGGTSKIRELSQLALADRLPTPSFYS
jgi:hypothetical protein